MSKKILLIDAYNMIHRARFGYGSGEHAITYNFFRSFKAEIARHEPDKVYIVSEGHPKHRIELSEGEYKGNRLAVEDNGFYRQKDDIFELLKFLPVNIVRHPDYECDDVIGTLSRKFSKYKDKIVICSSDSDFIQLLDDENISLWNPVKKEFVDKWPVDYVTWKALRGDPTDNVLGIKGIGDKRAMKLAEDFNKLEDFLLKKNNREVFDKSFCLIQLVDIPWNDPKWEVSLHTFQSEKIIREFKERSFSSIIGKSWNSWSDIMRRLHNEKISRSY